MNMIQCIRRNAGCADAEWMRFVRVWAIVSAVILAATAIGSLGYHHVDEQFQILEFLNYKLGKSQASSLAWEFEAQIRPWIQPALYYAIAKPLIALGMEHPFILAAIFRLVSAFFGWLMTVSVMFLGYHFFPDKSRRNALVYIMTLLCFLPYMLARTSSESLSLSIVMIGYALFILGSEKREGEMRTFSYPLLLVVGFLWGLAFEFRYQVAFFVAGLMFWLLVFGIKDKKEAVSKFFFIFLGIIPAIAIGTLIDFWGYGTFTIAPWNYFYQNIVNNVAAHFGTLPFWGYLFLVNKEVTIIATLPLTIGIIVSWFRFPKHSLVWGTLLFVLAHSAIGHKEARFMMTIAAAAAILFVYAWSPKEGKESGFTKAWNRRSSVGMKILYGLNCIGLIVGVFLSDFTLRAEEYIYNRIPSGAPIYALHESPYYYYTLEINFYRPETLNLQIVESVPETFPDEENVYLIARGIVPPLEGLSDRYTATPAHTSLPQGLLRLNFFDWISRAKMWTIYKIEASS